MRRIKDKGYILLIITAFVVLTMLNRVMVTAQFFNPGMNLYYESLMIRLNAWMGDLGLLLALVGLFLILFKTKRSFSLSVLILGITLSVLVFSLKIYAFYYGTAFSFFNARTFSNSAPVLGQQLTIHLWRNLFRMGQYIALIPAFLFIYLGITLFTHKRFKETPQFINQNRRRKLAITTILTGLLMTTFSQMVYYNHINNTFYEEHRNALKGVQTMGIYNYYLVDLISYTVIPQEVVELEQKPTLKAQVDAFIDNAQQTCPLNYEGNPSCINADLTGIFEGKKLVILQLEALNDYMMNLSVEVDGISYEIMPFMNSIVNSDSTLYYDKFYSNFGVGKTSDAEFAALTGLYPTGQIVTYFDYLATNFETIPSLFKDKGYKTYGINGSTESFYKRFINYELLGFEEFVPAERLLAENYFDPEQDIINGWVDDTVIFDYITDVLQKDEDQFVFGLSTVTHTPYFDVEGITSVNVWEETIVRDLGNYFDFNHRFDKVLEAFFTELETLDILKDTVFMMYGDHTGNMTMGDLKQIYPDITHHQFQELAHNVPFLIYAPGMDLSGFDLNTSLVRGQADIKRTVSNLFNLNEVYHFGVEITSNNRSFSYNPMTLDLFTDDYHLIVPALEVDNEAFADKTLEIQEWFLKYKLVNDAILKYRYFDKE
ncbi:LTA synthase family protein [Acholeplasma vituli]|uniref:LTA synthase family protein n=1 Tax=Paracholeplasma vituli TaxID=69473 RepID=A0ABT2PZY0_9MOLU|nr:LTA synthase family protein [Paracholeplasma vituli]MCU0105277.1 LTA synthase family protein [Paracholeplasma vituli]